MKRKMKRKIGRGERERKSILTPTRYKEVRRGGERSRRVNYRVHRKKKIYMYLS